MNARTLSPLLALALLPSCVVEAPPGPTTVVVTVHPWPADAPRPGVLLSEGRTDARVASYHLPSSATEPANPWRRAAELFTGEPVGATVRDEGRLPGSATTLAEVLTAEGFETGAFVSGERFAEASGIFQGFLHLDEAWLRAHSDADTGPLGAAFAAAQFTRLKIPRPLEDTGFAWLHLEFAPNGATRAALDEALALVRDGLEEDADAVVALVDLAGTDGALAIDAPRGAAGEDGAASASLDPSAFTTTLRAVMRAADEGGK